MRTQHIILAILFSGCLSAHAVEMANIPGGSYRPLYLKKDTPMISVKPFQIDKTPVTNAEFAQFVKANPKWQRGNVSVKQAESNYLKQWDKNGPKAADANKPVTNVSWFAAHAYCAAQGKRLPTNDEWEFVGLASELQANGSNEPSYSKQQRSQQLRRLPALWHPHQLATQFCLAQYGVSLRQIVFRLP